MTPEPLLHLHLRLTANTITLQITGPLTAVTAHLLTNAVTGILHRHAAALLGLDLSRVTAIDSTGQQAIEDCEAAASRRGMLFSSPAPAILTAMPDR